MSVNASSLGTNIPWTRLGAGGHATDAAADTAWRDAASRAGGVVVYQSDGTTLNRPLGLAYYNTGDNTLRIWNGSSYDSFSAGGAGGVTEDGAYSAGRTTTVDAGARVWNDATAAAANALEINKSGAGSGNLIDVDISAAHTGNVLDVEYTAAATGNALDVNFNNAGAARAVSVATGGTATTSAGWALDVNIDDASSGAAIDFVTSAAATGDMIHVDTTGATACRALNLDIAGVHSVPLIDVDFASTASGAVIDVDMAAAYTGNVIDINLTNATAAQALVITEVGATTVNLIDINDTSTANTATYDHDVGAVRTGPCMEFDVNADMTADVMSFLLASQTTGNGAISIDEEGGASAGHAIQITKDSTGASVGLDINISGAGSGAGGALDIDISAAFTGDIVNITNTGVITADIFGIDVGDNAAVGAQFMVVDLGNRAWTADQFTIDTGTAAFTGSVLHIDATGAGSAASNLLELSNSAAAFAGDFVNIGTAAAAAGAQMIVMDAGGTANRAFTADQITVDSGTGAFSGNIYDVDVLGAGSGHALDISIGAVAYTGHLLDLSMGATATGGQAIVVDSTAAHTVALLSAAINADHTAAVLELNSDSTDTGGNMIRLTGNSDGNYNAEALLINLDDSGTGAQAIVATSDNALTTSFAYFDMDGIHTAPALQITSVTTNSGGHLLGLRSDGGGNTFAADAININLDDAAVGAQWLSAQNSNVFTSPQIELVADGAHTESVLAITSSGVGASGQPAVADLVGSANLVAGADLVRMSYTGSPSSTSHVCSIEQSVGAGAMGSYALYVSASGANVQGLWVDAGTSRFTEAVTFAGAWAYTASGALIADPGNGGAIGVTISGVCALTSGGAGHTRTLAIPSFVGQQLTMCHDTDGGSVAVTAASAINEANDTIMTFNDVSEQITLIGITVAGTRAWSVLANDGVTLS